MSAKENRETAKAVISVIPSIQVKVSSSRLTAYRYDQGAKSKKKIYSRDCDYTYWDQAEMVARDYFVNQFETLSKFNLVGTSLDERTFLFTPITLDHFEID